MGDFESQCFYTSLEINYSIYSFVERYPQKM